jgi:hypothetical protein
MPGDPGVPVVTTLVCSLHHLHARLRVHWAPGIPHALFFQGRKIPANLGRSRRENAEACFDVIASEAKQSILRHSGMVRRTRPGISRFRVRCFASPRNDGWIASLRSQLDLNCLGYLKIEIAVREVISQNALVMPGLDPGIHQSS